MNLKVIEGHFSVCRLNADSPFPDWALLSSFYSISKSADELSVVCESKYVSDKDIKEESGWSLIKVIGPLDFSLTGILASLANPLAEAELSLFAISTFETDYLMVKKINLLKAIQVLEKNGFVF